MPYEIADKVYIQKVGAESVIMDLNGGFYFELDPVATDFLHAIVGTPRLEDAVLNLVDQYQASQDTIATDLRELLDDLVDHGLVKTNAENN